jgi:hypothetical protein
MDVRLCVPNERVRTLRIMNLKIPGEEGVRDPFGGHLFLYSFLTSFFNLDFGWWKHRLPPL